MAAAPGVFVFWERPMSDTSGSQSEITIACIQMEPIVGAKQANVAKSLEWIGQAALNGARLIVLPAGAVAIAATGDVASARAAQQASNTVPVVFTIGGDPIRHGLILTMNRW